MRRFYLLMLAGVVATGLAIGCNNKKEDEVVPAGSTEKSGKGSATEKEEPTVTATKQWDPALGTATIQGVVKFNGKPPKRRPIDMGGKPECAAHATEKTLDESIIVNADGTMKNVFVYVRKGVDEWIFPMPEKPVVLDQKGCTFSPHVVGARVGQEITVRNSDTCSHNVRSAPSSPKNAGFNFMQTRQGKEDTVKFTNRDVFVKIKCDLHGWMGANIGVVDHPYFFVTGDDGKFVLKNLPKGEFTIEARHEELGRKSVTIKVGDKETKDIEFEFTREQ